MSNPSEWRVNQPLWILGSTPGYFESWTGPDQCVARLGVQGPLVAQIPVSWLTEREEGASG